MAYVRSHGNQLAIVHGERDPDTRKVQQQVLFTICSKREALAALDRAGGGMRLDNMLARRYPQIRFDWDRIRAAIEERMDTLPDIYPYRAGEVLGRFRADLCAFTRQLGLADPQSMHSAAELLREHRVELEYLREVIDRRLAACDRRLAACDQQSNAWNGDNTFYWRRRLQRNDVPGEVMETMAETHAEGDLDKLEALARLFIDSYEGYAEGHNYLGYVAQDRGELEEAVEHFERAMAEGRKLFPKRLAKKDYWTNDDTRPYIRAMRNLAATLMRLAEYEEALEVCERLQRECGDDDAATTYRAHIYLNMGRWTEAREAAKRLVGIWPEHAYVVAFAAFEQRDRDDALRWFLHGTLALPRTGHILLGLRISRPQGSEQARDHNIGVNAVEDLEAFLTKLSRASRAFFKRILNAPTVKTLLTELDEVIERRHEQHRTGEREAFDRMLQMRSVEFARERAEQVRAEIQGSSGFSVASNLMSRPGSPA